MGKLFCSRGRNMRKDFEEFFGLDYPNIIMKYDKFMLDEYISNINSDPDTPQNEKTLKINKKTEEYNTKCNKLANNTYNYDEKNHNFLNDPKREIFSHHSGILFLKNNPKQSFIAKDIEKEMDDFYTDFYRLNSNNPQDKSILKEIWGLRNTENAVFSQKLTNSASQFPKINEKMMQKMKDSKKIEEIQKEIDTMFGNCSRVSGKSCSFGHFLVELFIKSRLKILSVVFPNVKFVFSGANENGEAEDKFLEFINEHKKNETVCCCFFLNVNY